MDAPLPAEPADEGASADRLRVPTSDEVLKHIDAFLARHPKSMNPTKFGLEASGEGNLIKSLREGRQLTLAKANRIADFMAKHDREAAAADPSRPPFSSAFSEAAPIAPQPSSSRLLDSLADAARRTA